jgi:hypothetical protein
VYLELHGVTAGHVKVTYITLTSGKQGQAGATATESLAIAIPIG